MSLLIQWNEWDLVITHRVRTQKIPNHYRPRRPCRPCRAPDGSRAEAADLGYRPGWKPALPTVKGRAQLQDVQKAAFD